MFLSNNFITKSGDGKLFKVTQEGKDYLKLKLKGKISYLTANTDTFPSYKEKEPMTVSKFYKMVKYQF